MKKMWLIPVLLSLLLACSPPEFTSEQALRILQEEGTYPKTGDYVFNLADPDVARRALATGLEAQGYITVRKSWTMANEAEPFITFTEKARPYLLGTPKGEDSAKMRIVRTSTWEIDQITKIEKIDDSHAVANYTMRSKHITPFAALSPNRATTRKNFAEFEFTGGKWQLQKRTEK
ncbi:hypothetical protein ABIE26_002972 [Pedobacter africanus]|uniref:hypothetical protein n=1 Tax=Pedobacter africanus TaxID=151894 RepID=UPI003394F568